MTDRFSYSFSLPPPPPRLHEHGYNEFLLSLPLHWRQTPTSEDNTFNFHSEALGAAITVSCDFHAVPQGEAKDVAESNLASRLDALQGADTRTEVFVRTARPHSGGLGLEMALAVEVPDNCVYFYVGYVTSRKVLNFTLVCPPGRAAAIDLFNEMIPNFRPLLP